MHPVLKELSQIGLVPVIKITDLSTAVPLAKALVKGGIPCAEITFRTDLAADAMALISAEVPEILLGAGTVTSTEQVDRALAAGAKFIVSPGLNPVVVRYCQEKGVPITPGISTPTELEQAMSLGLTELKFFPAENNGGIKTIKAISAAYPNITFMPTGGINLNNLNDYLAFPKILACGGSWVTPAKAIDAGNFEEVTRLAAEAVKTMLGCKLLHLGVNTDGPAEAEQVAKMFCALFGLEYLPGNSSDFAGDMVEVMKFRGAGKNGHIGVQVNNLTRAVAYFTRMGFPLDEENYKYNAKGEKVAIYFKNEIGGFAIHLVQKK